MCLHEQGQKHRAHTSGSKIEDPSDPASVPQKYSAAIRNGPLSYSSMGRPITIWITALKPMWGTDAWIKPYDTNRQTSSRQHMR